MFPQGRFWVNLVVGSSEWAIYLADLVMAWALFRIGMRVGIINRSRGGFESRTFLLGSFTPEEPCYHWLGLKGNYHHHNSS
jgi:hypothetical protein